MVADSPSQSRLAEIPNERTVPRQRPLGFGDVGDLDGSLEPQAQGPAGQTGISDFLGNGEEFSGGFQTFNTLSGAEMV